MLSPTPQIVRGGTARAATTIASKIKDIPPEAFLRHSNHRLCSDDRVKVPTMLVVAGDARSHPFHSEAEPIARNVRRNLSVSSPK